MFLMRKCGRTWYFGCRISDHAWCSDRWFDINQFGICSTHLLVPVGQLNELIWKLSKFNIKMYLNFTIFRDFKSFGLLLTNWYLYAIIYINTIIKSITISGQFGNWSIWNIYIINMTRRVRNLTNVLKFK